MYDRLDMLIIVLIAVATTLILSLMVFSHKQEFKQK